ncbi:MAG TPA: HEAT repeat domain-containing protein [Xanthobacteraceae bacterium]
MPFVRRGPAPPATSDIQGGDPAAHLAALRSPDAEARWRAARALSEDAAAVPALAAALAGEMAPRVREAIMTALMRIGDAASVQALLPYLRSEDAGRRGAAIEALQALPAAISPFMAALLADADSDVRLLATELARNMPAPQATKLLSDLIEREQHPNVCAAAVDVLAEVGTLDAVPALRSCAERFAGTAFLPFAVAVAIGRISGTES